MSISFGESLVPLSTPERPIGKFRGEIAIRGDFFRAIDYVSRGIPLAYDNDCVGALIGDASNPQFFEGLLQAKDRQPTRTVGLIVPFHKLSPLAHLANINESSRELLSEPGCETLEELLGALAFVRFPGDPELVAQSDVPDCAIGIDQKSGLPLLQTWSPQGKYHVELLEQFTDHVGIRYLCATSLNRSGESEIILPADAAQFCEEKDLPMLADYDAGNTGRFKAKGSFSIVTLTNTGIEIAREGSIGNDIIAAILEKYAEVLPAADEYRNASYPDRVLHFSDLPEEMRHLRGAELSQALRRDFFKWQ